MKSFDYRASGNKTLLCAVTTFTLTVSALAATAVATVTSSFIHDEIVAIRRVNIVDRELDKDGEWADVRKPFVEIEVAIEGAEAGSNLQHVLQIGDRDFGSSGWTSDRHILFLLDLKDYASLKNEDSVTYRLGIVRTKEIMEQLIAEGRSTSSPGRKLGRLRKAMVDDFAPIERKRNLEPLH